MVQSRWIRPDPNLFWLTEETLVGLGVIWPLFHPHIKVLQVGSGISKYFLLGRGWELGCRITGAKRIFHNIPIIDENRKLRRLRVCFLRGH
jgi:hypothetical protein